MNNTYYTENIPQYGYIPEQPVGYDFRSHKKRASELLSQGGLRLTLITSLLICGVGIAALYAIIRFALTIPDAELFDGMDTGLYMLINAVVSDIATALLVLFTVPLLYGVYSVAAKKATGCDAGASQVFFAFSSGKNFVRFLGLVLRELPEILGLCATVGGVYFSSVYLTLRFPGGGMLVVAAVTAMVILGIAVSVLIVFLSGINYGAAALMLSDDRMSAREAFRIAREANSGRRGSIFAYKLSFITLILLSALTIGVLFLIHTLPYMAVCGAVYADKIKRENISDKEINHE